MAPYADEVLELREIRRASATAQHIPIASTSAASMRNGKVRVDLLFSGDAMALRAVDDFSMRSLSIPVSSKYPKEVWGASCSSWIAIFGRP